MVILKWIYCLHYVKLLCFGKKFYAILTLLVYDAKKNTTTTCSRRICVFIATVGIEVFFSIKSLIQKPFKMITLTSQIVDRVTKLIDILLQTVEI